MATHTYTYYTNTECTMDTQRHLSPVAVSCFPLERAPYRDGEHVGKGKGQGTIAAPSSLGERVGGGAGGEPRAWHQRLLGWWLQNHVCHLCCQIGCWSCDRSRVGAAAAEPTRARSKSLRDMRERGQFWCVVVSG